MKYQPYPAYKDSGVDWLGDVPEHWDVPAIRRVSQRIKTGSTPPTAEKQYYQDGTVPWFGPGSFGDHITLSINRLFTTELLGCFVLGQQWSLR
jgi:type I restriction enzyme, S subunit